jgi:hypothetical protein
MDIKELEKFLTKNKNAKEINLESKVDDINGVKLIAEFLKKNDTVTKLSLIGNNIKNKGAKYISEALKVNKTLEFLDLSRYEKTKANPTMIAQDGSMLFLGAVAWDSTPTVPSNNIGNKGAQYIAEGIKFNVALKTLSLANNNIGKKGAEAFKDNKTLTTLELGGNKIKADLLLEIEDSIDKNIQAEKKAIKETARFLVDKFVTKDKKINLTDEIKHLRHYQSPNKKEINSKLNKMLKNEKNISSKDSPVSEEKIQRYIQENFLKLSGVSKKSGMKDKSKDSDGLTKTSAFEVPEMVATIASFLGDKSLRKIKPSKAPDKNTKILDSQLEERKHKFKAKFAEKILKERKDKSTDISR